MQNIKYSVEEYKELIEKIKRGEGTPDEIAAVEELLKNAVKEIDSML